MIDLEDIRMVLEKKKLVSRLSVTLGIYVLQPILILAHLGAVSNVVAAFDVGYGAYLALWLCQYFITTRGLPDVDYTYGTAAAGTLILAGAIHVVGAISVIVFTDTYSIWFSIFSIPAAVVVTGMVYVVYVSLTRQQQY